MLHMPSHMLGKGQGGRTYEELLLHFASLNPHATRNSSWDFNGNEPSGSFARRYIVTNLTEGLGLILYGSPWGDFFNGALSRTIGHALPNRDVWMAQIAEGRQVYIELYTDESYPAMNSVSRNGDTSNSIAADHRQYCEMERIIFWDGEPKVSYPRVASGPYPYSWSD